MTDDSNNRLQMLFDAASDLPREQQRAWLERECGDDETLIREVISLLEHDVSAEDLLDAGMQEVRKQAEGLKRVLPIGLSDEPEETRGLERAPNESPEPRGLNQVGKTVGPYKLLQRIGEGGMGTVYMAEQDKPVRRRVALKIIKPGLDTKQVIARFEAERQALAMMDHNHIARVLDAGATDDGHPYFAMELVKGIPITQYCDDNKLTVEERLELFIPVCHAIQHAHQKGIIHRDIKPSNVLVSMHDGKPVPKVIDFGVAKATHQRLTEKTMFTALGQVVGTLEYMSPEQAEMNQLDIDTRSDVYSLGVMLYELLTGTTPITSDQLRKAGISEVLKTIRQHEPPKPSTRLSESSDTLPAISSSRKVEPARLSRLLRGDLDWIVMKTLEKDRTRRYETANGLAADIGRYLKGDPVEAGPPSAGYRLQKMAKKHRSLLVTGATISVVLILATGVSTWLAYRAKIAQGLANTRLQALTEEQGKTEAALRTAQRETKRAETQQEIAEVNAKRAEFSERRTMRLLYRSDMREAVNAYQDFNQARVRDLLLRHVPQGDQQDNRDFVWNHLWNRLHAYDRQLFQGTSVEQLDLSADGQVMMTRGIRHLFHFWDTSTGQQIGMLQLPLHTDSFVRLSPDGSKIVHTGYGHHHLQILDWRTLEGIGRISVTTGRPEGVAWSPDGHQIATASRGGTQVFLYNVKDLTVEKQWKFEQGVHDGSLTFSPDGKFLAYGSWHSKLVRLVEIKSHEHWDLLRPGSGYSREAGGVVHFSPNSSRLATCGRGGVELWDVASRKQVASYEDDSVYWCDIAWQPDSTGLFVCGGNQLLHLSAKDLSLQQRLPGHAGRLRHLQVMPDGAQLISSSIDGTIHIRKIEERLIFDQPFTRGEFREDGSLVATAKRSDLLQIAPKQVIESTRLETPHRSYSSLRSDGRVLALGHRAGVVSLWNLDSGDEVHADLGLKKDSYSSQVHQIAFQPNGNLLAISSWDGTYLVDSDDFSFHGRFRSHRSHGLAFAPDGLHFAVGYGERSSTDNALRIYSVDSSNPVAILHDTAGDIRAVAFSEDGRWVASGGGEQVIRLSRWPNSPNEIRLTGHQASISAIAFSPDGECLISGDLNGHLRIWSVKDRELIAELDLFDRAIHHIDFSPDGTRLAIASESGLEILNAGRSQSFDSQIETTHMLAHNRIVDFYSKMAERERNPQYLLNAAQHCYWRADEAVQAQNYESALDHLEDASKILGRTGELGQEGLDEIRTAFQQKVILTRWGCHVELGNGFRYDPDLPENRCLLRPFYARTRYSELNSALRIGLSHFLRNQNAIEAEGNEWTSRLSPFLATKKGGRLSIYSNAKVAYRHKDGSVRYTDWIEDPPPSGSQLLGFGFDSAPVQAVVLQDADFDWLEDEKLLETMTIDVHQAPDEFWHGVSRLKQLKSLSLKNWTGSRLASHQSIAALTSLESLRVDSTFNGFEHLGNLKTLPNLKKIVLHESWLSKDNISVLRTLPHLTELELSLSVINDAAMPELAKMRQLEALYIDGATVSEEGIRHLTGHPNLQRLDLFEVPIGDDVVETLIDLPKLQIGGLFKTEVSLKGVSKLRAARPNCLVMHQQGYLNIGESPIPELGLGSAPDDTTYFPTLSSIQKLANQPLEKLAVNEKQLTLLMKAFLQDPNPEVANVIYEEFAAERGFWESLDLKTLQELSSSADTLSAGAIALAKTRIDQQTCLRFNGKDSWIDISELQLDPKRGLTIEAWVRPEKFSMSSTWGDEITVAGTGNEFSTNTKMRFRPDLRWSANMEWPSKDRGYRVVIDRRDEGHLSFTHLASVISEKELSLFVNGRLVNRVDISTETFGQEWRFGIGSGSSEGYFQGLMDEVRVSNSLRYTEDFVPDREFETDDDTVLLYHFDANPFGLAYDHSVNGKHVHVQAEFVKLNEPAPSSDSAEESKDVLASLFREHIQTLEQVDVIKLPVVKPMVQYKEAPKRENKRQTAIRFNGTDGNFTSPTFSLSQDSALTIEARVKPEGIAKGKWGSQVLTVEPKGDEGFPVVLKIPDPSKWLVMTGKKADGQRGYVSGNVPAYADPIDKTSWAHLAVVIANNEITLFVNGERVGSTPLNEPLVADDWQLVIGGSAKNQKLIGLIDEVRVSDTARYQKDFEPQPEFTPDKHTAVLYYFDANEEGIIWDHSGNKRHVEKANVQWIDVPADR